MWDTSAEVIIMAKKDITHPDVTRGPRNDVSPVPSMLDSQAIAIPNSQLKGSLKVRLNLKVAHPIS